MLQQEAGNAAKGELRTPATAVSGEDHQVDVILGDSAQPAHREELARAESSTHRLEVEVPGPHQSQDRESTVNRGSGIHPQYLL